MPVMTRRQFLATTGSVTVAGCLLLNSNAWAANLSAVRAGKFGELNATAEGGIDLFIERRWLQVGGKPGRAITINGSIPGPVIRMTEGKEALIRVHNRMEESTSLHWHGILLPFNMDGVPGISYPGIAPGATFTYRYPVRQNGTYWYHSHTGLQEQLGHYGQLILEPADPDPMTCDIEHSIILSDWTFEDPDRVLWKLNAMGGYYNFQRPTLANIDEQMKATGMSLSEVLKKRLAWDRMRMDPTDIADITGATYTYLMNGKAAHENPTFIADPGQRVRLRIVNASTMTFYDFRIPGLPMTVVQSDGQNIKPVETDELRIGVAETYDVIVTLPDARAYTLFAETMDRSGYARGTLAPRQGMSAHIPEQRRRPMLTMADMGMIMQGMGGKNPEGMQHAMPQHSSSVGIRHDPLPVRRTPADQHDQRHHDESPDPPARHVDGPLRRSQGLRRQSPQTYGDRPAVRTAHRGHQRRRPRAVGVSLSPALSHGSRHVPHRCRRPFSGRRSDPCQIIIHFSGRWLCSPCCWCLPPRHGRRKCPRCRARPIGSCTVNRPQRIKKLLPGLCRSNRRSPQG
jgi:CopA family copper-resistance protein